MFGRNRPPPGKPANSAPTQATTVQKVVPGDAAAAPSPPSADAGKGKVSQEAQRRAAMALRMSASFAQIVTVLMRSPLHKNFSLGDLEWLVIPPLLSGQFAVAEVRTKEGATTAAAIVLWASVSPEVDKRLSQNLDAPIRLRPDEWKSGDILWLVEAVGDGRLIPGFIKQLGDNTFKGKSVKMRVRGKDGKPMVKPLQSVITEAEKEKNQTS